MNMPPSLLKHSAHQLDELFRASPAVVYATDADWWRGRLHYICLGVEALSGIDRDSLYAEPASWLALLTPESRQSTLARLARAIDENSDRLSVD